MRDESKAFVPSPRLSIFFLLFILQPSTLSLRFCPPELDLIFELDAVLAAEALANLFGERQSVAGARVLALGDDEVGVDGRDDGAAAALALHPHLVNHPAGAQARARRVLEEAAGAARAVRLRGETFLLGLVHARLDLFGVVGLE